MKPIPAPTFKPVTVQPFVPPNTGTSPNAQPAPNNPPAPSPAPIYNGPLTTYTITETIYTGDKAIYRAVRADAP